MCWPITCHGSEVGGRVVECGEWVLWLAGWLSNFPKNTDLPFLEIGQDQQKEKKIAYF